MSHSYGSSQFAYDDDEDPIFTEDIMSMHDSTDQILFAIDCGQAMHTAESSGKIPIKVAFDAVFSVIMNKMIGSTSDRVGVLLFSVESDENKAGHKHIHLLQDLAIPDAARAKMAESYGSEGDGDILRDYGLAKEEYPFGNVFWTKKQRGTRRVFVITNEDNPHQDNESLRQAAIQRAKDLYDVGIQVEVFGLNKKGHRFDPNLFYSKTIPDTVTQLDETVTMSNDIDELLERVRRSEPPKRTLFQIPFRIGTDLEIGVKGYALIMEQKRSLPQPVSTVGEQITEVVSDTTYKCADTNQNLLPSEIKYSFNVGGEQSVFSKEELQKLRTMSDPSMFLRLLSINVA
ncbi:hypothetical protein BX666DRAFT_2032344 [Dichotomocladium elegans]|nr:hypothetical protein BX666DRAFT_2032344 [Dichotomocladium elegans]